MHIITFDELIGHDVYEFQSHIQKCNMQNR